MNWNGRGEAKVRLHLTEIARMNADVDDVQSAILLGTGYEIAEITLRTLWKTKRAETEFTVIYDHLHFIPLNGFGVRLHRWDKRNRTGNSRYLFPGTNRFCPECRWAESQH